MTPSSAERARARRRALLARRVLVVVRRTERSAHPEDPPEPEVGPGRR